MRFVAALVYVVNAVVLIFPGAGFLGDFVLESTGNITLLISSQQYVHEHLE